MSEYCPDCSNEMVACTCVNDIEPINSLESQLPFGLDDKIFYFHDEDGNHIGEPYSYNDYLQKLKDISGVNPELCGE